MAIWRLRLWAALAAALAALAALHAPARAQDARADESRPRVELTIDGPASNGLEDRLRDASQLLSGRAPPPPTMSALRRAARADVGRLARVLRAEGYYAGEASFEIDRKDDAPVLTFNVSPGEMFRIDGYRIEYADAQPTHRPSSPMEIGIGADGSPRGEDLLSVQAAIARQLRGQGYPAARTVSRRVEARFDDRTATAVFVIESGPRGTFGDVRWIGLERTRPEFLERRLPWTEGEAFDMDALATYRDQLSGYELFSSIQLAPGVTEPSGATPVIATVAERSPRTIGAGATYSTNLGPGGRLFWEHRNLAGQAETLRAEASLAEVLQSASLTFRKPFPTRRTVFFTGAEIAREDSEAFRSIRATLTAGAEKRFRDNWRVRLPVEVEAAEDNDAFEGTSILLSVPVFVERDATDSRLNPKRGTRASALIAPNGGLADGAVAFTRLEARAARHQPFFEDRLVLSAWTRIAGTIGPETEELPANKRFYSGGAGSVRGYGYQLIGPLDENNDPVGGRSAFEAGFESRWRFTDKIEGVAFIEGGSAFDAGYPDFDEQLLYGAGAGARYHTPVGPVRLDIAFPLERRDGVDDAFQFYISLGQAF